MTNIFLVVVFTGNLKVWSDSPFNFLSTHNALQLCNVSRYRLKIDKFSTGAKRASCPTYQARRPWEWAQRPEEAELIIVYDVGFSHQLHLTSCCAYKS